VALVGCGEGTADRVRSEVLATVGDDVITDSWYERTYVDFLIRSGQNDTDSNRRAHLENLIDAVLLSQEAARLGLTEDSVFVVFRERERKKALGAIYFDQELLATLPPPTDEEVRLAFARWKAQVIVRHLFFNRKEEADMAYRRLQLGADFLGEAQDLYGVPGDSAAGYLGPVKYFQMDDAFAEATFSLEEGSYSEPVQSRFGWHIIRSERVLVNPLLTEDEYQVRRGGLESQFRLRRRNLEGNAFVRSFMQGLNVDGNGPAIGALAAIIDDLTEEAAPQAQVVGAGEPRVSLASIDSMRSVMNAGTVLATYDFRGRTREFTAGEYLRWIEDLPFEEARKNTVNSVGRALRNEVFALEAERIGVDGKPAQRLQFEAATLRLAGMLRNQLRADPGEVSDSLLNLAAIESEWYKRRTRTDGADPSEELELLRRQIGPIVAEFELLRQLRSQAIAVDTLLFESLSEGLDVIPERLR
jgi:parvulin-like peptidyl-prolyl isomerase